MILDATIRLAPGGVGEGRLEHIRENIGEFPVKLHTILVIYWGTAMIRNNAAKMPINTTAVMI